MHADSDFPRAVARLLDQSAIGGAAVRARAYHNDVEIWANRDSSTCDQQRDFAVSLWRQWSEMREVPSAGSGVEIKSYTGSTIASAEQGFRGAEFTADGVIPSRAGRFSCSSGQAVSSRELEDAPRLL